MSPVAAVVRRAETLPVVQNPSRRVASQRVHGVATPSLLMQASLTIRPKSRAPPSMLPPKNAVPPIPSCSTPCSRSVLRGKAFAPFLPSFPLVFRVSHECRADPKRNPSPAKQMPLSDSPFGRRHLSAFRRSDFEIKSNALCNRLVRSCSSELVISPTETRDDDERASRARIDIYESEKRVRRWNFRRKLNSETYFPLDKRSYPNIGIFSRKTRRSFRRRHH